MWWLLTTQLLTPVSFKIKLTNFNNWSVNLQNLKLSIECLIIFFCSFMITQFFSFPHITYTHIRFSHSNVSRPPPIFIILFFFLYFFHLSFFCFLPPSLHSFLTLLSSYASFSSPISLLIFLNDFFSNLDSPQQTASILLSISPSGPR